MVSQLVGSNSGRWKPQIGGRQREDDLLAKIEATVEVGTTVAGPAGNSADPSDDGDERSVNTGYSALLVLTTLPLLIRTGAVY